MSDHLMTNGSPLQHDGKRWGFICVECSTVTYFHDAIGMSRINGATFNCANVQCQTLYIAVKGTALPFHKYMHDEDSRWPEDGADTNSVDLDDDCFN